MPIIQHHSSFDWRSACGLSTPSSSCEPSPALKRSLGLQQNNIAIENRMQCNGNMNNCQLTKLIKLIKLIKLTNCKVHPCIQRTRVRARSLAYPDTPTPARIRGLRKLPIFCRRETFLSVAELLDSNSSIGLRTTIRSLSRRGSSSFSSWDGICQPHTEICVLQASYSRRNHMHGSAPTSA